MDRKGSTYRLYKIYITKSQKKSVKRTYKSRKKSTPDSAFVFKNLKTFLANVVALVISLMSFGRQLNNLETDS